MSSLNEVDDELEIATTYQNLDERPVKETGTKSITVDVHDSEGAGEETATFGEGYETELEEEIKRLLALDSDRTDRAVASEVGCHPRTAEFVRRQRTNSQVQQFRHDTLEDAPEKVVKILDAAGTQPERTYAEVAEVAGTSNSYPANVLVANPHLFEQVYRAKHGRWVQGEGGGGVEEEAESEDEDDSVPEPKPEPDLDSLGGARGDEKAESMLSKPQEEILWRYDMGAANVDSLAERAGVDLRTVLLTLLTHRA